MRDRQPFQAMARNVVETLACRFFFVRRDVVAADVEHVRKAIERAFKMGVRAGKRKSA